MPIIKNGSYWSFKTRFINVGFYQSGVEDFSISEKKVADEILEIMRKTKQRLIVATFASNVHRVSQIIEAAVKCKRKVIVFGRSMEMWWILDEKWVRSISRTVICYHRMN